MADPELGHYRPWLEDIRKDKPYQLEDRVEQLFHEKSVTAYSAWNRLFDETIARPALQGRHQVAGDRADAQPAAGLARGEAQGGGAGAGGDVQGEHPPVHAHHQHARQGQGNFRSLARLRRRRRCAPSVQPGRARGGRRAGDGGARRLSAAVASLLRAQGALVRQEAAGALGPQRAAAEGRDPHHRLDRGAGDGAHRLWRVLAPRWRRSRSDSSRTTGSTRRCGPARRRARSRIRPCRRRIPTCCSTTRASRAT